jgi:hypothetical protein
MRVNHALYIELLEQEVLRLREETFRTKLDSQLRKEEEAYKVAKASTERKGGVANLLHVTDDEVKAALEYAAPRHLGEQDED